MPQFLSRPGKPALAYELVKPAAPDSSRIVFLPGFQSDMTGTKATFLEEVCKDRGFGYLRFDYSGHGASEGVFEDFCLSDWLDDTLDLITTVINGPCILAGSSMGGWIALRAALHNPDKVCGLIGIAAAPDFTRDIRAQLSEKHKKQLDEKGYVEEPTPYSETPHIFTQKLLDDGENHILLDDSISLNIPVTLIQGMEDEDVAWQKAVRLGQLISPAKARIYLLEEADHRLSTDPDLQLLRQEVLRMTGAALEKPHTTEKDVETYIRLAGDRV